MARRCQWFWVPRFGDNQRDLTKQRLFSASSVLREKGCWMMTMGSNLRHLTRAARYLISPTRVCAARAMALSGRSSWPYSIQGRSLKGKLRNPGKSHELLPVFGRFCCSCAILGTALLHQKWHHSPEEFQITSFCLRERGPRDHASEAWYSNIITGGNI